MKDLLTNPQRRLLVALVIATAGALGLVAVRMLVVGTRGYGFLAWNLFLAWVPCALGLLSWRLRRAHIAAFVVVSVAWLAFFPNAPYIVTDLMHLRTTRGAPLWLDGLVVGAAAATGLFLGLASLHHIQSALTHRFRRPWVAACIAVLACYLAAVGVYLGRFLRWNTWDLLSQPDEILADAWATLAEPRLVGFVAALGTAVVVAYVVYRLVAPRLDAGEPEPPTTEPGVT